MSSPRGSRCGGGRLPLTAVTLCQGIRSSPELRAGIWSLRYRVNGAGGGISFGADLHRRVVQLLGQSIDRQCDWRKSIQECRVLAHFVEKRYRKEVRVLIRDLDSFLD